MLQLDCKHVVFQRRNSLCTEFARQNSVYLRQNNGTGSSRAAVESTATDSPVVPLKAHVRRHPLFGWLLVYSKTSWQLAERNSPPKSKEPVVVCAMLPWRTSSQHRVASENLLHAFVHLLTKRCLHCIFTPRRAVSERCPPRFAVCPDCGMLACVLMP